MPDFEIDLNEYDPSKVKPTVSALAACFNAAVSLVVQANIENTEINTRHTLEVASTLFKENFPGKNEPISLSLNDQAYLKLVFMQVAAKLGPIPGYVDVSKRLSARTNKLFEGAERKGLIQPPPADLL
jgi:hypothetical protein